MKKNVPLAPCMGHCQNPTPFKASPGRHLSCGASLEMFFREGPNMEHLLSARHWAGLQFYRHE